MGYQLSMHSVLVHMRAGIVYAGILASLAKSKLYVMLDLAIEICWCTACPAHHVVHTVLLIRLQAAFAIARTVLAIANGALQAISKTQSIRWCYFKVRRSREIYLQC